MLKLIITLNTKRILTKSLENPFVLSKDQLSDTMTKSLSIQRFLTLLQANPMIHPCQLTQWLNS